MVPRTLIRLTNGDDVFAFSGDLHEIRALSGFDQLTITGNDNLILGGPGWLTAVVTGHDNTSWTGAEGSSVQTAGNRLVFEGGAGRDSLTAYLHDGSGNLLDSNDGLFNGRAGRDEAFITGERWYSYGGVDNDNLSAEGSDNRIFGGAGNDRVSVAGTGNVGQGGPDNDNMFILSGSGNRLTGNSGNDFLEAKAGTSGNILDGGLDNDSLINRGNTNVLIGGRGYDNLSDLGAGVRTVCQCRALEDAPISATEFEFITGFTPGEDVLDFAPLAARIGRALTFVADGAFTGAWQVGLRGGAGLPGWLVADLAFSGPFTVIEVNGPGRDLAPDMRFILQGVDLAAMSASDFLLS